MSKGPISQFIEKHYLHFNSASLVDAAKAYEQQLANGAKMLVSMAGAMSTAEIGKIFAEIIRQDKVQIISCTLYTSDAADDLQCGEFGGRRFL